MQIRLRISKGKQFKSTCIVLPLEIEDHRAFILWDCVHLGAYDFKTRIEIDPKRLRRIRGRSSVYSFQGTLVLPRPEDN